MSFEKWSAAIEAWWPGRIGWAPRPPFADAFVGVINASTGCVLGRLGSAQHRLVGKDWKSMGH